MSNAAFTICAKNYLAQALTLRDSVKRHNADLDFYIFLSDLPNDQIPEDVIPLDESWIKRWREMAFKYNVIEFSTSIKPFCFNRLFDEKYDLVIYLDPDIYVTNSLNEIFGYLENKSIVLSPHYCHIQESYSGSVLEEELLFVGIYNLGFAAIKNNAIGKQIIDWWMNRLSDKCFADKWDALHVDQRWMDFVPGFFPEDTYITQHPGINPAIWNLHERELFISEGQYMIRDSCTKKEYPLLFFHFSGFDPFNDLVINRRYPQYNTTTYPSFAPLFQEYREAEYSNEYNRYSKMAYSFNTFESGENILAIHRRIYRVLLAKYSDNNPFQIDSRIYKELKKNKLISKVKSNTFRVMTSKESQQKGKYVSVLKFFFRTLKRIVGVRYYMSLLYFLNEFSRFENQTFLLKKNGDETVG